METDRFGNHTVKVYFHADDTEEEKDECAENFIEKWDAFEKTYEPD